MDRSARPARLAFAAILSFSAAAPAAFARTHTVFPIAHLPAAPEYPRFNAVAIDDVLQP